VAEVFVLLKQGLGIRKSQKDAEAVSLRRLSFF